MDYITVTWHITKHYKTNNSRTLKTKTRNYSKMFGMSIEGYESAKKFVELKSSKGYPSFIISEHAIKLKLGIE